MVKQISPSYEKVNADLLRIDAVLWMLIRIFGGEIPAEDRPKPVIIVNCLQYTSRVLDRISEKMDGFCSEFNTEIFDARGLAQSLEAMTWSDGMQLMGSDEMMSGLIDAIADCIRSALEYLDLPDDRIPVHLQPTTSAMVAKVCSTIKSTNQRTSAPAAV